MAIPETNTLYCYRDYKNWPADERWEIIKGDAYNMSPAPSRIHQKISGMLYRLIASYLEDKTCEVYFAPFDVLLPENEEADEDIQTIVQPDISVICDPSKLTDAGCKGAPDWIIEIASPSTASKDAKIKFDLYQKHKVKEYWIVHPESESIETYVLDSNNRYSVKKTFTAGDIVDCTHLTGLKISINSIFKK